MKTFSRLLSETLSLLGGTSSGMMLAVTECICLSRELTVSPPRKVSISFNWIKLRSKDSKIVCVAFKLFLKFRTLFIRRLAAVEIPLGFMEKHFPGKSIYGKLFGNCSALQC